MHGKYRSCAWERPLQGCMKGECRLQKKSAPHARRDFERRVDLGKEVSGGQVTGVLFTCDFCTGFSTLAGLDIFWCVFQREPDFGISEDRCFGILILGSLGHHLQIFQLF